MGKPVLPVDGERSASEFFLTFLPIGLGSCGEPIMTLLFILLEGESNTVSLPAGFRERWNLFANVDLTPEPREPGFCSSLVTPEELAEA